MKSDFRQVIQVYRQFYLRNLSINASSLMDHKGTFPCLHEPAAGPYPEPTNPIHTTTGTLLALARERI
jgi:hypothetical protein